MKNRNCPNCGAPYEIGLDKCPYCGTIYYDMSAINFDEKEPIFLTLKKDGYLITLKALPNLDEINFQQDIISCSQIQFIKSYMVNVSISFNAIADEKNSIITVRHSI